MTPPPTNAPEAGSNGEREALADMRRAIIKASTGHCCPTVDELRVGIASAGFTRAHHNGETMSELHKGAESALRAYRKKWHETIDERDAAIARAEATEAKLAEADKEWGAMMEKAHAECVLTHNRANAAERERDSLLNDDVRSLHALADQYRSRLDASDKRAAALADGIRAVCDELMQDGHDEGPSDDECGSCRVHGMLTALLARAALAGNGNGTGEG